MNFGERVKQQRENLGWSQDRLAEEASKYSETKIDQGHIGTIEIRDQKKSVHLQPISIALGCNVEWMATGIGEEKEAIHKELIAIGISDKLKRVVIQIAATCSLEEQDTIADTISAMLKIRGQ